MPVVSHTVRREGDALLYVHEQTPLEQTARSTHISARCANLASCLPEAADGAVAALLGDAARLLGADAAAFASFMRDDETYESYRFILACDPAWCLEYENGACYMHDPWLEYARHHSEPTLAADIVARTQRERDVVALAKRFGFESAVIVPTQSPQGLTRLGALCLGSIQSDYFDSAGFPSVSFAATPSRCVYEWQIRQLGFREMTNKARLSSKDLTFLRHERLGHGSKGNRRRTQAQPYFRGLALAETERPAGRQLPHGRRSGRRRIWAHLMPRHKRASCSRRLPGPAMPAFVCFMPLMLSARFGVPWLAFGAVMLFFPLLRPVFGAIAPGRTPAWDERVAAVLDRVGVGFTR